MLMLVTLLAAVAGLIAWRTMSATTSDLSPHGRMSARWLAELRASSRR